VYLPYPQFTVKCNTASNRMDIVQVVGS